MAGAEQHLPGRLADQARRFVGRIINPQAAVEVGAARSGGEPVVSTRAVEHSRSYGVEFVSRYAIEVTADAQVNGKPSGRRVPFEARGWSQRSLLEHPDKYRVVFLGQKKELEGRDDAKELARRLWEYKPEDYAAIVATQHYWSVDDMSCIVTPLRVTPVEDPELGTITPASYFRPELHAQMEASSTLDQRLSLWLGRPTRG